MEASSRRLQEEQFRKEELQKQIAKLQAELSSLPKTAAAKPRSPKRKKSATVLAPATPSPRKKQKLDSMPKGEPIPQPKLRPAAKQQPSRRPQASSSSKLPAPAHEPIRPSNLLQKLSKVTNEPEIKPEPVNRSTSFAEQVRSASPRPEGDSEDVFSAPKRDENLMLVEDLEPGPYEFTAPSDDPLFQKLEPHSGIALTSRKLSHEDFADHLRGRFYLSPSRLYSTIRLQPDKQGYDVPVPGDWVTIAVIAERGPIKRTRAPVTLGPDEDAVDPKDRWKKKKKEQEEERKPAGKQFLNLKLVDFGARTTSSATGGKAVVRGDAFLSLLLFEADSVDTITHDDGRNPEKLYRGGSRGAFEMFEKLKPGDVIALLNPRVLKPYQRASDKPHPVDNILAVTPESVSSIAVIGKSRDLGRCGVRKKDGSVCGGWCDKRVSDVCEFHVQTAIQHNRASRPEFTAGTGGMTSKPTMKRKTEYDPAKQWGLRPEPKQGDATYIVSGHIVGGGSGSRSIFASENIGREGQAKAKRKLDQAEADRMLKQLVQKDKDGMEAVLMAREGMLSRNETTKGKGKAKTKAGDEQAAWDVVEMPKKSYSGTIIRSLGFDPTHRPGHRRLENTNGESKFVALQALSANRSKSLGRAPKQPPPAQPAADTGKAQSKRVDISIDLDDDSEDERYVDLDDF
ncbi:hypothetical protein FA15DRAFT_632659 [Coprinopsis marcescibilis]|uniref:Zinc finger Mcm10/DnaG-type domain-containing protein n=1 Tax=Coprinopsis marcescibilis TaxID=230819 RepID=A0A5C3L7Z3_COPMA|nr:hypothetical protein FA15DRAFT_632659 [Coprinopsis marcescibilis]